MKKEIFDKVGFELKLDGLGGPQCKSSPFGNMIEPCDTLRLRCPITRVLHQLSAKDLFFFWFQSVLYLVCPPRLVPGRHLRSFPHYAPRPFSRGKECRWWWWYPRRLEFVWSAEFFISLYRFVQLGDWFFWYSSCFCWNHPEVMP